MPLETLSPARFKQKRPGGDYQRYRAYLDKNRPARIAARQDPLRARTDAELNSRSRADINALVKPEIADITRAITQRARAGTSAIGGYTNQVANALSGYQDRTANIYADAQSREAAVNAALAGRLTSSGEDIASQLSGRLAAAGLGGTAANDAAAGVRQTGQGSGNALYAHGSASLSDLINRGAGAQEYAARLPGIARLEGLQAVRDLQARSQRDLADQLGEVRSRVPGMIAELTRGERSMEFDKILARLAQGREQAKAVAAGAEATDKSAQAWTRIQQIGERLKLQAGNASFNQAVSAARLDLSQQNYRLALQKEARLAKGKGKGGFTAAQKQNMAELAVDTAKGDFFGEVYDGKGNITGHDDNAKLTPRESLQLMIAKNIPFSIALKAIQYFGKQPDAPPEWKATLGWGTK